MSRLLLSRSSLLPNAHHSTRLLSTTPHPFANPLPLTTPGPPPAPPTPSPHTSSAQQQRRRQQAALLQHSQDLRSAPSAAKPGAALKKRFWKEVHIKQTADGQHNITLDARAVRAPSTKSALHIPSSKPQLAAAIALEWDLLVSAAQALKSHLIPLTSLAARAADIAAQDNGEGLVDGRLTAREEIILSMLRYFDTDTLLCWAPVKSGMGEASGLENGDSDSKGGGSLREMQIRTATPIISFLTGFVWPGVRIHPALEESGSLMPRSQEQVTKDVVRGWMAGLGAWELAGLERATLASKSLLIAARLVVEWSERFQGLVDNGPDGTRELFTIEKAAEACSLEVAWQTGIWGEVEDTHDVEKEDLRRQLGSVVLLVSGTGEDA